MGATNPRFVASTATRTQAAARRGLDLPTIEAVLRLRSALERHRDAAADLRRAQRQRQATALGHAYRVEHQMAAQLRVARTELDAVLSATGEI